MSNIIILILIVCAVVLVKFWQKVDLSKVSGKLTSVPEWLGFVKKAYFWITIAGIIVINLILAYYSDSWQKMWAEKLSLCLVTNLGILISVIFMNESEYGQAGKTVGSILISIVVVGFFYNSELFAFGKTNDNTFNDSPPTQVQKTKVVEVQRIIAPVGGWSKPFKLDTTLETGHTKTRITYDKPIKVKLIGTFGVKTIMVEPGVEVNLPNGLTKLQFQSSGDEPVEVIVRQW